MLMKPSIDFVFKKLFGAEESKESLISLLNAIIKSDSPIQDVEILNNDLDKEHPNAKFSRLDIKAKTDKGDFINIEIQVREATDEVLRKAKNQLYKISLDKDSIARYREIEKRMYDEISALDYAEKKGIQKGEQIGIKKGELKAKYDLAKKSLSEGLPISLISKLTGLSEDELKKL